MIHSPGKDDRVVTVVSLDEYLRNRPVRFNPERGWEQLYFHNPKFGFYLVQLITARLLENCASIETLPNRWPDAQGPRTKAAA